MGSKYSFGVYKEFDNVVTMWWGPTRVRVGAVQYLEMSGSSLFVYIYNHNVDTWWGPSRVGVGAGPREERMWCNLESHSQTPYLFNKMHKFFSGL